MKRYLLVIPFVFMLLTGSTFFFHFYFIFYWNTVALHWCVSFCYTAKWVSHMYTYVCMHAESLSCVWLCATAWTVAHQAPLSMGFFREEYWSGLPCPSLGDLPDPGVEPVSLKSPALTRGFFTTSTTWEAHVYIYPLFLDQPFICTWY